MERIHLTRELFPALADNDFAYLNSGSSGPPTYQVLEAMHACEELFSGPAYLEGTGLFVRQAETNALAREAAARLIGADPENVALTQNTTHGMNLGAASIDWKPGDEVISSVTEHPGCLAPLHALRRRHGVRLRLIPPPVTAGKIATALRPRTRLVALSHVDWTTGEVLPLRAICALARDRDVLTLVDGAQSVGNVPVNAPASGADMYAFTGHKWVLGPDGMGAFYVRPGLEVHSANVGYASLADPAAFDPEGDYELRAGARRFEASTVSPTLAAGFAVAAGAAHERREDGLAEIRRRADLLLDLLSELPRVTLHSPRPAGSGLVSFEIEDMAPEEAARRLLERRFVVRYIPQPNPCVRASVHLFNPDEELEALAVAVGAL